MILIALVSLVGFCCFVWSAWNNYSTIRDLKNQLEIHKIDTKSLGKSAGGSITIKVIGYVWAMVVTLLLSCAGWGAAPHISPHSIDYFLLPFILLGGPVAFCCFAWSALDDYLTIRRLKSLLELNEVSWKER
jgi:hypothetical protein